MLDIFRIVCACLVIAGAGRIDPGADTASPNNGSSLPFIFQTRTLVSFHLLSVHIKFTRQAQETSRGLRVHTVWFIQHYIRLERTFFLRPPSGDKENPRQLFRIVDRFVTFLPVHLQLLCIFKAVIQKINIERVGK